VRLFKKDDPTFDFHNLDRVKRWRGYVASYMSVEPTEEIDASRVRVPYLKNRFAKIDDFFSDDRVTQMKHVDKITVTISPASYAMKFISTEPYGGGGIQYFLQTDATRAGFSESVPKPVEEYKTLKDLRQDRVQELLVRNNSWMKDLSRDEVDARKLAFKQDLDVGAKSADSDGEDVDMADP
jgi:paired amphipathic helix protein Sin3a